MTANKQLAVYTSIRPLTANGFFAPLVWENAVEYSTYAITLTADRDCAITVQFSNDRFNITLQQIFNVVAGTSFNISDIVSSGYFRLRVDNLEATAMTVFSLATYLKNGAGDKLANIISSNIWTTVATGVGGVSSAINASFNNRDYTFFGNVSGATVLTVQISNDFSNWYDTQYSYMASTAANFGFNVNGLVAQFVRLKSSANITATAICNVR